MCAVPFLVLLGFWAHSLLMEGGAPELWVALSWRDRVIGLVPRLLQLSVAVGTSASGRPGSCGMPPSLLLGSLDWGSAATAQGPKLQALPMLILQFCLFYGFHSTYLYRYRWVELSSVLVLGKGPFVELWMFSWLQIEGESRESISSCHDADITPQF